MATLKALAANKTVVAVATARDGVKISKNQRFPEVEASHKPIYVIVPQLPELSGKVKARRFVNAAEAATLKLLLSFGIDTLL